MKRTFLLTCHHRNFKIIFIPSKFKIFFLKTVFYLSWCLQPVLLLRNLPTMARHLEPLEFLQKTKIEPGIFSPRFFSSTIFSFTRIERHRERVIEHSITRQHATHYTLHCSLYSTYSKIDSGLSYTDT